MNTQNQNNDKNRPQGQNQNQGQRPEDTKKAQDLKNPKAEEMNTEDQKDVKGGSGLLSGGNDLTNVIQGGIGVSNSSSGSHDGHSYNSEDSHNVDLGLGNILDNTNY